MANWLNVGEGRYEAVFEIKVRVRTHDGPPFSDKDVVEGLALCLHRSEFEVRSGSDPEKGYQWIEVV